LDPEEDRRLLHLGEGEEVHLAEHVVPLAQPLRRRVEGDPVGGDRRRGRGGRLGGGVVRRRGLGDVRLLPLRDGGGGARQRRGFGRRAAGRGGVRLGLRSPRGE